MLYTCLLLLVAVPSLLYAHHDHISLHPEEAYPGDVIMLQAKRGTLSDPKAEFLGKAFRFYKDKKSDLIALLPVDLKAPTGEHTILIRDWAQSSELSVYIKEYAFATIEITVPEEKVTLSPEDKKRVENEYLLLQKIWRQNTKKKWEGSFVLPTDTPVSEEFGVVRVMNEKKKSVHRGLDLRGETGTPVRAINAGRVILQKELFYGGNTLVIDHGTGLFSYYMHLSAFSVPEGSMVNRGDRIGSIGMTGRATGPHLHISVKLQGVSVNPLALIRLAL